MAHIALKWSENTGSFPVHWFLAKGEITNFFALPGFIMGQILHSNIELNCFASGKMISSYKGEYMC